MGKIGDYVKNLKPKQIDPDQFNVEVGFFGRTKITVKDQEGALTYSEFLKLIPKKSYVNDTALQKLKVIHEKRASAAKKRNIITRLFFRLFGSKKSPDKLKDLPKSFFNPNERSELKIKKAQNRANEFRRAQEEFRKAMKEFPAYSDNLENFKELDLNDDNAARLAEKAFSRGLSKDEIQKELEYVYELTEEIETFQKELMDSDKKEEALKKAFENKREKWVLHALETLVYQGKIPAFSLKASPARQGGNATQDGKIMAEVRLHVPDANDIEEYREHPNFFLDRKGLSGSDFPFSETQVQTQKNQIIERVVNRLSESKPFTDDYKKLAKKYNVPVENSFGTFRKTTIDFGKLDINDF